MQATTNASDASNPLIVATLLDLLSTCRDAERGYQHAAELSPEPTFHELFSRRCLVRQEFVLALKDALFRHGRIVEDDRGSVLGAIHRGLLDAVALIPDGRSRALVSECERGDGVAVAVYQAALDKQLPKDVREILDEHMETLVRDREELRSLFAES